MDALSNASAAHLIIIILAPGRNFLEAHLCTFLRLLARALSELSDCFYISMTQLIEKCLWNMAFLMRASISAFNKSRTFRLQCSSCHQKLYRFEDWRLPSPNRNMLAEFCVCA